MSDISAIVNETSMSTAESSSEELTESQVKGLVEEAQGAIDEGRFERARAVIIKLSEAYHKGQAPKGTLDILSSWIWGARKCPVTNTQVVTLFEALCKKNREEGEKLIPVLLKDFSIAVNSIEVDGNHYEVTAPGFERSFTAPIKPDEGAVSQNVLENSPIERMKEEEAMVRALSPNMRAVEHSNALKEKLKSLAPLLEELDHYSRSKPISMIVKFIAPYDPLLARTYADKLEFTDWTEGCIEISRHQTPEEAQKTLDEIKKKYPYPDNLTLVYREERRRDLLKGAEQTLAMMRSGNASYRTYIFAEVLLDYELEGAQEAIEQAHKKEESYYRLKNPDPKVVQYLLLNSLRVEAKAEHPLAFETLEMLRQNAPKIRQSFIEDESYDYSACFASAEEFDAYLEILCIESGSPFLAEEFEKDLQFCLKRLQQLKAEFADDDDNDEYDLVISMNIKEIAKNAPDAALQLLRGMTDEWYRFDSMFSLIRGGHPRSQEFIEELLDSKDDLEGYQLYALCDVIFQLSGIEKGRPYLEKAKSIASDLDDDDELSDVLRHILKIELKYHLPSAKETLEQIHAFITKLDSIPRGLTKVIVEAELSLLIASFQ